MPRFAILEHAGSPRTPGRVHWDLLFEAGEALRAWELSELPLAAGEIAATALPDHRRLYLDYEGPVSGGRGTVKKVDAGTFEALTWDEDRCVAALCSQRLNGVLTFERDAATPQRWRASWRPS